MLVTTNNLTKVIAKLRTHSMLALDTETTGLRHKDKLFSVIITGESGNYYFNFNGCKDMEGERPNVILPRVVLHELNQSLFNIPSILWIMHHAKFDLKMLYKDGCTIAGPIHDTKSAARVICNTHMSYSLDNVAWRELGVRKDDGVWDYINNRHKLTDAEKKYNNKQKDKTKRIKKEKCYVMEEVPGKKTRVKRPFFHKVPFSIMVPYGERDAAITFRLGKKQLGMVGMRPIWETEKHMSQIVKDMELEGIKIDVPYVNRAIEYERGKVEAAKKKFVEIADIEQYVGGPKMLEHVFDKFGVDIPRTPKGNPSFKDDVLEHIDHPIVEQIRTIREHEKKANTYYSSYLYLRDNQDKIHCSLNFDGTDTGRFSSSDPNLQNVNKEEVDGLDFYVRKSFIPNEDEVLLMIDYDQQEFRMMLDYAGQHDLIEEILQGKDVHDATADKMGVTRKPAKTLNYGLIYGMGIDKLAWALGCPSDEAKALKQQYFSEMPDIKVFIQTCMRVAKQKGFVRSWAGRYFFFPDRDFCYKAPNKVIQGGCADVIKKAMVQIHEFLKPYKTHMKLQVHDELIFGLHKDELHLAPKLKQIMEDAYVPMNRMKLTCTASWSPVSWGHCDKIEGFPPSKSVIKRLDIQMRA